jgi:hypothetical protein
MLSVETTALFADEVNYLNQIEMDIPLIFSKKSFLYLTIFSTIVYPDAL